MALFDWLFRKSVTEMMSPSNEPIQFPDLRKSGASGQVSSGWQVSESGNLTRIVGNRRHTLFESDGGWKFCVARTDGDDDNPIYSDPYILRDQARDALEDWLSGRSIRHRSLTEIRRDDRRETWIRIIRDRKILINEIENELRADPKMRITGLRKSEAKLASHLKQLDLQASEYRAAGVPDALIQETLALRPRIECLSSQVASRIAALQARRPPPKPRVSASRLTDEEKAVVDGLVALLDSSEVLSGAEIERRHKASFRAAFSRMTEESMNYGQAVGFPVDFPADDQERRDFMKVKDQDLEWQVDITKKLFEMHLEKGEMPAPHYPRRIMVLMRKARDYDRERVFLTAWRRHFPSWWQEEARKMEQLER